MSGETSHLKNSIFSIFKSNKIVEQKTEWSLSHRPSEFRQTGVKEHHCNHGACVGNKEA